MVISKKEFLKFTPKERGYVVYMVGNRDDQPFVQNEENPYPEGTVQNIEWEEGRLVAVIECQDCP